MKRLSEHLKRLFEKFNLYQWNNPYLKLDSEKEVEKVHQSPPRTTPLTISEKILLVPQYMTAISIYLDLCLLYYSVMTLGGLPLAITFAFAFYSDQPTPFTIGCAVFVGHLIASAFSLKLFFSNKERVRWLYDLIGEHRIRYMVFSSPPINGIMWKGSKICLVMVGGEVVTHAGASAVDSMSASHELAENEQRLNDQLAKYIDRKEGIYQKNVSPSQIREEIRRQNNLMDRQTEHYNKIIARVTNRPHIKGGIFREMINVELTLETRKAFVQALKEWFTGKR